MLNIDAPINKPAIPPIETETKLKNIKKLNIKLLVSRNYLISIPISKKKKKKKSNKNVSTC